MKNIFLVISVLFFANLAKSADSGTMREWKQEEDMASASPMREWKQDESYGSHGYDFGTMREWKQEEDLYWY